MLVHRHVLQLNTKQTTDNYYNLKHVETHHLLVAVVCKLLLCPCSSALVSNTESEVTT